ncbi:hypothetical protein CkaCkLH20_09298 [Colletotrichum karsti]|uniref:Uncharacterized protein n=1 Tax=Colletotrichum karsti TaxID=1095194 RepID=A0A9P6LI09_9PEZI|nr:uncharacterized protein CkaCkLH20_09298 [Colletotrichum karsti]KAF9873135.1 hypothetical protein CkaCkLH20_09298 [Colletotrichum karsti]
MPSTGNLSKWAKFGDRKSSLKSDEPSVEERPVPESPPLDPSADGPTGLKLLAITFGLCLTLFLVGLDNIIISTAIPRITDEFSSINDIGWYGSAYLLTTCTFQLTFGKLYTLFSIKLTYLISILIFEIGSAICGAAPQSAVLIVGRAIAGIGCSGILAGTFTIIAVIIPLPKRPAYTGLVGGVYAIASVVGPLLGGVFTDKVTWRWCFYINLPVGAVALVIMIFVFKSPPRPDSDANITPLEKFLQIDPLGTAALMPAVICLLLALQWGGTIYPWNDARVIVLFVLFGVLSVVFVIIQVRNGKNATLPLTVVSQRSVAAACWFSVCTAGADFTLRQYIPIWFQAVKGVSAVDSGLMNLALILATALASILSGVGITKIGYYNPFMIAATLFMSVGAGLLTTWKPDVPSKAWIGYQVLYGMGSGQSMQTPLMVVQTVLPMAEIPLGTALVMFLQTFGGAIFISVAQNVFTNELRAGLASELPNINATAIVDGGANSIRMPGVIPPESLDAVLRLYTGIPVDTLMNSQTGVYVGCDVAASGLSEAMTANRVSWFFGLRGPSLTLDTACSSSLYALHLACQSLKQGETNMGLVAGVNLILHPNFMHQLSSMHMLSPEGISHSFDHRANGYGRGEGIGCLILKRLKDALRDGDTIRAVVRGTGTNADGKTPGITQPSSEAQAELIRSTYEAAGLSLSDTQYFEAHGTGTPLGDPIELSAIGATLGAGRTPESGPLYVGSIKANVGHTEGCSGLAGVLKSIVCLEKGILVPTAGIEKLNPKLKLSEWNLALPSENMLWPATGQRRVSVNSFGFGGANAHVILDDAHNYLRNRGLHGNHNTSTFEDDSSESGISLGSDSPRQDANKRLFAFSSKDQSGIERLGAVYADYLSQKEFTSGPRFLGDLAYTLSMRRAPFEFRSFAVADSISDLQRQISKGLPELKRSSKHDNLVFVFTGQGAQWPAMGRELLNNCIFRTSINKSQVLLEHYGCLWDLTDELSKTEDSNIDLPQYSQVLCTVLQIALVDLLRAWGITPKAVVGHSSGEIGAAYAAGLLSRCNAVKVAYLRGICSAKVADIVSPRVGAMLAAGLSEEEATAYLKHVPPGSVVVACVNSPSSVTLSGGRNAVSKLSELISADGKFARMLRVKTAYHSPHMATVAKEYMDRMGVIIPLADQDQVATMFSSLTGKPVTSRDLDGSYWMRNMCEQVRFSQAMGNLLDHAPDASQGRGRNRTPWSAFVELGPHGALQSPVGEVVKSSQSKAAKEAPYLSAVTRGKDAELTALQLAGQLWASGHSINLARVNMIIPESLPMALPDLPSYPWNHKKGYWHESAIARSNRFPASPRTDLLGVPVDLQNPMEPRWRNYLRISENPWIEDHKITGTTLYPAAGMIVMAMEAARQLSDHGKTLTGISFHDLKFERGLVVASRDQAVQTEISLRPDDSQSHAWNFTVFSTTATGSWTRHCYGNLQLDYAHEKRNHSRLSQAEWSELSLNKEDIENRASKELDMESFYDDLEAVGVEYGPTFRNVFQAAAVPDEHCSYGSIAIPDTKSSMPFNFEFPHLIHPATMDAIFHLLFIAFSDGQSLDEAAVPYTLKHMYVSTDLPQGDGSVYTGFAKRLRANGRETSGDLIVSDESWSGPKIIVRDFALRQVTSSKDSSSATETASRKVCAKVRWKADLDLIRSADSILSHGLPNSNEDTSGHSEEVLHTLSGLLDKLYHKTPNYQVLLFVTEATESTQRLFRTLMMISKRLANGNKSVSQRIAVVTTAEPAQIMVEKELEDQQESSVVKKWEVGSRDSFPFEEQLFDLVLTIDSYYHAGFATILTQAYGVTHPSGHIGILQSNVFSAIDMKASEIFESHGLITRFSLNDNDSRQALILTQKPTPVAAKTTPKEVVLLRRLQLSPQTQALEESLVRRLKESGCQTHPATLDSVHDLQGKHVISLLEVETPFVYDWTDEEFSQFRRLVSSTSHILWITRGGLMHNWHDGLEFAPSQGLLRVLRTEYSQVTLPHLDLSRAIDLGSERVSEIVLDVWNSTLRKDSQSLEMEYAELNGTVFIPRFIEDDNIDMDLDPDGPCLQPVLTTLGNQVPRQLTDDDGRLVWLETEPSGTLGPQEIEITVETAFVRKSTTRMPDGDHGNLLAQTVVGIVSATSPDVTSFEVGERVVALQSGPCRTKLRLHESLARLLTPSIPAKEVVSLVSSLTTAQYALLEATRLERGQTVIVRGADTAIGLAAVQLAQSLGAEIFLAVKSIREKSSLSEQLRVSEDQIFGHGSNEIRDAVLSRTGRRGADVVLNCDQTCPTAASLESLAEFGTFIDFSGDYDSRSSKNIVPQNITMATIDASRLLEAKPAIMKRLFDKSLALIEDKQVVPLGKVRTRSIADLSTIEQDDDTTEFVLYVDSNAQTLVRPSRLPDLRLDSEATYVLAGGFGALGLQIADMMFQHGAGHVVFLSRSGGDKNLADLTMFRDRGSRVHAFKCDVSDPSHVKDAVERLVNKGCRIRGVIQCAMVLEARHLIPDAIFENMTYDQWQKSTRPKIRGTMNLHNYMPKDMEFFILLSSITCVIGNAAQSNYAAGNTFEDAFAHYRRSQSLATTAIDVGLVTDSAHFTGDFDMDAYLQMYEHRWDGLQTTQAELDAVLKAAMRGRTADGQPIEPQIVLGLGSSMPKGPLAASWTRDPKFSHRVDHDSSASSGSSASQQPISERVAKAETQADAVNVFEDVLKMYAAQVMDIAADEVDAEKAFYDFGVDSLKAVELRNRIFRDLQTDMSVFELLSPSPLSKLASEIAGRSKLVAHLVDVK